MVNRDSVVSRRPQFIMKKKFRECNWCIKRYR